VLSSALGSVFGEAALVGLSEFAGAALARDTRSSRPYHSFNHSGRRAPESPSSLRFSRLVHKPPMGGKHGQGGASHGPSKQQRAAQSARDKARHAASQSQSKPKFKKLWQVKDKSSIPLGRATGSKSSKSMVTAASMVDTFTVDYGKQGGNYIERDYTLYLGTLGLTGLPQSGSFFVNGAVAYATLVDVNMFLGSGAEKMFGLFEKFRVKSATLDYITGQQSGTTGDFYIMSDLDPANRAVWGSAGSPDLLTSHRQSRMHTAFPSLFNTPLALDFGKWLYTDPTMVQGSNIGASALSSNTNTSIRENSCGVITIALGTNVVNALTNLGDLVLKVRLCFRDTARSDVANLLFNGRLSGQSAYFGTITSATQINPISFYLSQLTTNGSSINYEFKYNPAFVAGVASNLAAGGNGGTLNLPVGCYRMICDVWINSSGVGTLACSQALNLATNNGSYSNRHADSNEGTPATAIEWASTPATTISLASGVLQECFTQDWRVSQAQGPNSLAQFNPTITMTATGGPFQVVAMVVHIARVYGFENDGMSALFPKGNANGAVNMSVLIGSRMKALQAVLEIPKARPYCVRALLEAFREECWSDSDISRLLASYKLSTALLLEGVSDPTEFGLTNKISKAIAEDEKSPDSGEIVPTPVFTRVPTVRVPEDSQQPIKLLGSGPVVSAWLPNFARPK